MPKYIVEIVDAAAKKGYYIFNDGNLLPACIEFDRCRPEEAREYDAGRSQQDYFVGFRDAIVDIREQTDHEPCSFWVNMILLDPNAPFLSARQSVVRRWFATYNPKDKSAQFQTHS